jgi:hypothetical protein
MEIHEYKAAIEAVSGLRDELGAVRVNIEIHVDKYEKGCKTDVSFFTSTPADASRVPGCGPACKGD